MPAAALGLTVFLLWTGDRVKKARAKCRAALEQLDRQLLRRRRRAAKLARCLLDSGKMDSISKVERESVLTVARETERWPGGRATPYNDPCADSFGAACRLLEALAEENLSADPETMEILEDFREAVKKVGFARRFLDDSLAEQEALTSRGIYAVWTRLADWSDRRKGAGS